MGTSPNAPRLSALNGLSQLAFKALLPGVPDFYQGSELWNFSLADPDNRRPIDFDERKRLLSRAPHDWSGLANSWADGRIKFELTRALLRARRDFADLFTQGTYRPMPVSGPHADHVIAFTWQRNRMELVVTIGRHFAPMTNNGAEWPRDWNFILGDMSGIYRDALADSSPIDAQNIAELFRRLPVALFHRG